MDQLTSVHVAMTFASIEDAHPDPLHPANEVATFRISKFEKEVVQQICQRHGTSLSSFVRACCVGLIRDYMPEGPCDAQ